MTTLEIPIGKHGKVRIWLQDTPDCRYPVVQAFDQCLRAKGNALKTELCVAVEICLPLDASYYGLLGARFEPAENGDLRVRVEASGSDGLIIGNSLVSKRDRVRIGLALEYAAGAMQGAVNGCQSTALGPGTLTFDCAAHGEIGSSLMMFQWLAEIVVHLLPLNVNTTPESVVEKIQSAKRSLR